MKKKRMIFSAIIISVVAIFSICNMYYSQRALALSDLALVNVEALADPNESDCNININGYRDWNVNHGFLEREKQFYDCCSVLRIAYSPSGICRNS